MMLNPSDTATGDAKSLAVVRAPIEVVLSEDAASPLSLVLPPFEDIREITSLKESHFSIRDWSKRALASVWEPLHVEYESLLKKRGRFENSQILLNRLANISSIEGNLADERAHLRAALLIKHSEFLKNRLIDNLIAGRHDGEADALLAESDLATSIYANLRLASKLAIAGDIGAAVERVTAAVGIDPLDFGSRLFEGSLKLWQGDNEGAILSFRIASERRKNSAALYTNMAVAYVRMGRIDKASHSLRRAIAIEPLNLNAVTFLADLAFAQNRDEDSIPALRYLIQFEQKSSGVWGRLARALLRVGSTVEAIAAIKRQASLENSSEVWNNLGVAYHAAGEMQRSMESFKYAMQISSSVKTQGFCLAAKNIAALISRTRPSVEVLKFIEATINAENRECFVRSNDAGSIFMIQIHQLIKIGSREAAVSLADSILVDPNANWELTCRIATSLLAVYSLNIGWLDRAYELANRFKLLTSERQIEDSEIKIQLLNNIAFVYIESEKFLEAESCLQEISGEIHKNAYVTATSGLLHLRKGHVERADSLYHEALRLSTRVDDKARIRQKWNLEIGRALISENPSKAQRFLSKARDEKGAEDGLVAQANQLLKSLPMNHGNYADRA